MYVYLCMYVCMHVCVYMYVCMYLSPLLQFHHGVFHNIFVAYSIMAYTQIATGLQRAMHTNGGNRLNINSLTCPCSRSRHGIVKTL